MLAISSCLAASIITSKVTVILALGLIRAWLARRSRAAIRHALLAAAFGVLFVLPIVSILAPPLRIAVPALTQEQNCLQRYVVHGANSWRPHRYKPWYHPCTFPLERTFPVRAANRLLDRRDDTFFAPGIRRSVAGPWVAPIWFAVAAWPVGRRNGRSRTRDSSPGRIALARGLGGTNDLRCR